MSFRLQCLERAKEPAKTQEGPRVATATPATTATDPAKKVLDVANVATVAVAAGALPLGGSTTQPVTCAGCRHFTARRELQPDDGWCGKYSTDTWGEVPFTCPGHEPRDEAVRAREARQARVEEQLRANPSHRLAFDVADTPLEAGPGEPVSVVLAVRHGEQILSGEVLVPREGWDLAEFVAVVDPAPAAGVPS